MPANIILTENFASLRNDAGYYVDKTDFFEQFLADESGGPHFRTSFGVSLFTRPRRFGKTLFLSMLAEFFDIRKNSRELLAGLKVAENETLCSEWMNRYPVIFLTFKTVEGLTFEEALDEIRTRMKKLYSDVVPMLDRKKLRSADRDILEDILSEKVSMSSLRASLATMSGILSTHYGKPAIMLLDEYDVPVAKAAERGYYDEMLSFMREFYANGLERNPHLCFAILAGVLRISQQSLFGDINNLDCFDSTSSPYSDVLGFTQEELDRLLASAGLEERRDELRAWYDGYRFGARSGIYCPWSIMRHLAIVQKKNAGRTTSLLGRGYGRRADQWFSGTYSRGSPG